MQGSIDEKLFSARILEGIDTIEVTLIETQHLSVDFSGACTDRFQVACKEQQQ